MAYQILVTIIFDELDPFVCNVLFCRMRPWKNEIRDYENLWEPYGPFMAIKGLWSYYFMSLIIWLRSMVCKKRKKSFYYIYSYVIFYTLFIH